jgi:hypothetical protein
MDGRRVYGGLVTIDGRNRSGMEIPHEIDLFNRTKRQEGEPVMTQKRLAELAGVRPETVTRHVKGWTGITPETEAKYREALRVEEPAA